MNLTRSFIIIAAAMHVLCGNLQAERTCRLVFPEMPANAPKVAFMFDGETSKQVSLPNKNFSEVLGLPDGDLTITMTAKEVGEFEALPKDAPTLKIPKDVQDFYIIISPNPENKFLPIQMELVDIAAVKLEPGQILWFNLTDHRIIGKLGDADMKVEPHSKAIVKGILQGSGDYIAEINYEAGGKAPLVPLTKQSWQHDAHSRYLGFITDAGGRLPMLHCYRDFRLTEVSEYTAL